MTTRVTLCRLTEALSRSRGSLIGELGSSRVQITKTGDVNDNGNSIWQLQLVEAHPGALSHDDAPTANGGARELTYVPAEDW